MPCDAALAAKPEKSSPRPFLLRIDSVLRDLNLCGHEFGDRSRRIADCALDHEKLQTFCTIPMQKIEQGVLAKFVPAGNIGEHGAIVLARLLEQPTDGNALREIDLRGNNLGLDGGREIATAVLGHPTLAMFNGIPLKKQHKLNTANALGKIGVHGAVVLTRLLETDKLDLEGRWEMSGDSDVTELDSEQAKLVDELASQRWLAQLPGGDKPYRWATVDGSGKEIRNVRSSDPGGHNCMVWASVGLPQNSGKHYWEITTDKRSGAGNGYHFMGVATRNAPEMTNDSSFLNFSFMTLVPALQPF